MSDLTFYNSLNRKKERFVPIDAANIRMYLCGPTVYDRAHIGNARNVIVFDVLFRMLKYLYGEAHVTYVRNFTDIDDKINARAHESGRDIREITSETTQWYLDDMGALGNQLPTQMPRATDFIDEMIELTSRLIDQGHAYVAEGHVLFAVESYAQYGALSGRSVDDMIAGARVEIAPFKRNPMDFVLWKPSAPDIPGWDSPWGRGRPGWHLECSAMSRALLGESFDIHGGGNDLLFPHHENEMAQSCCAYPDSTFARVWLHNEMLLVDGKKMSKSLGNFFTVRDLLDQGYAGEVIRFVFLSTHYGKPMDWTDAKAKEAEKTLRKWRRMISSTQSDAGQVDPEFLKALAEDINTAGAIAVLHKLSAQDNSAALKASAQLLGLLDDHMGDWASAHDLSAWEERLFSLRCAAMESKDFAPVDQMKAQLIAAGLDVRISKERVELVPVAGFDAQKLNDIK